jgi:hypothetical protein
VFNATTSDTSCHNLGVCDCRQGMDWWMDLLTTYKHRLQLHVITVLSLIYTLYKSPQHPLSHFPACCVFISRSMVTASNSGDSSASCAQVLSSQPSVQNWTLKWELPGWQPFHTNVLVFSSQTDFQLTLATDNWVAPIVFLITTLHGQSRKHRFQQ